MTIKMKDMLTLPVKRVPGGIMPFLKDGNGEVLFVGDGYHVDACVMAINAYDANQDRILKLENALTEMSKDYYNMHNVIAGEEPYPEDIYFKVKALLGGSNV